MNPKSGDQHLDVLREHFRVGSEQDIENRGVLTSSPLLNLLRPLHRSPGTLLLLLLGATSMEVLHHNSHEHVKNKESNKKQEGDEVDKAPFVEILLGLQNE